MSAPDRAAWRAFAVRLSGGAGIASLGAGAIFFVAANWQRLDVFGRFALIEAALAACAAIAWWRPPPDRVGRYGLVLASLLAGALLALYGQAYQTGADLYELFIVWGVLMLPFAFAARSAAVWAIWWIVANVAMGLMFGWLGPGHLLWRWIDRWGLEKAVMLLLPCAINLAGAALYAHLRDTRSELAPRWLARLLAAIAFAYGTAACILAIFESHGGWGPSGHGAGGQGNVVLAAFAVASVAVALATLQARRDVFPMALVMASWIAIATLLLVTRMKFDGIGAFMVVALWLIAASSGAGYALMNWVRAWRGDEEDHPASAPEGGRPWYVSVLLGVGGWFGALFLLVFVALAIFSAGENAAKAVIAGAVLVASAWGLYRAAGESPFTSQLALALSLAGQCLLLFGIGDMLVGGRNGSAGIAHLALAAAVLQVAMIAIMPSTLHRGMSTLFACMAWAIFVRYGLWDDVAVLRPARAAAVAAPGLALAGWLLAWLPVAGLLARLVSKAPAWRGTGREPIARPVAAGLVAALALATLLSEPLEAIAFLLSPGGGAHGGLALWPFLSAIAALGALVAAFALGHRGLMALCIAAALLHLSHFYYAMGATLLVKSATMIVMGAALTWGAWALKRGRAT